MQKSCLLNVSKNYKIEVSRGLMLIYDEVSELQYFYFTFNEIPLFKIKKNKIGLKFCLLQNILQMSLNELPRVFFYYRRYKASSPK